MPESGCRIQVASGVAVVTAPAEIDIAAVTNLRTALLQAAIGAPPAVVVDMSQTRLCDSAGLNLLVRVHKRALVFAVTGVDRVIPRSARCRAAWNREHLGDPAVEASALQWSVIAMSEAVERLTEAREQEAPRALAAVGEAVWWTTMVDATLVRHHPEVYETALAARGPAKRRLIDATLGGLRFVRNRIGREAGIEELIRSEIPGLVTDWTWLPAPEPLLGSLLPRAHTWEMARYRAYRSQLAGHTIGGTFERVVSFLVLTGGNAASAADDSIGARR
jgi:hypothetical protein